MALYDLHRSYDTPRTAVLTYRAASALFDLVGRLTAHRSRRASRTLLKLSDWQLADLGLSRTDLSRL